MKNSPGEIFFSCKCMSTMSSKGEKPLWSNFVFCKSCKSTMSSKGKKQLWSNFFLANASQQCHQRVKNRYGQISFSARAARTCKSSSQLHLAHTPFGNCCKSCKSTTSSKGEKQLWSKIFLATSYYSKYILYVYFCSSLKLI